MAATSAIFTHLEVHSHYTLLGGTASVEKLVARASAEQLPALALTDSNVLYGAVAFRQACKRHGIKPLVGMTVDLRVPGVELPGQPGATDRIVLLSMGQTGYRSLCNLSSWLQSGEHRNPGGTAALDWKLLREHSDGLLCLSSGRSSWVDHFIRGGQSAAAARVAGSLGGLFPDRFYLGVCPSGNDDPVTAELAALGQRFGLPLVAVQPICCLNAEEEGQLQLLAAISGGCRLDELSSDSGALPPTPFHWPNPDEFASRFQPWPDAVAQTLEVASRCDDGMPDGRAIWPVPDLPQDQTPRESLANLANRGLLERYGANPDPVVVERLQIELASIAHHGFEPLFLVVADLVRFARQEGIPVNTRGSVANSLVAYCAGITHVDPIEHDLLFERFLNPDRSVLPDIDLDLCSERRDEVLSYVRRSYGPERMALVGSMSTLQPRSALREAAKVYGFDDVRLQELLRSAPRHWHPDPRRRRSWQSASEQQGAGDEIEQLVLLAAEVLTGRPHHMSIHPGGVVLTPGPITDLVPVQMAPKGFLVTQYGHEELETIGLPKIDLLGIRALTVLTETSRLIASPAGDDAFQLHIPADDEVTGDLLARGETIGVFQCESAGAQRTLRQLKARNVRDLAIANAFFKPGPATGGMAQTFVRRYRGEEPVAYLHPSLEPILRSTMGVLIFQEQVLRLAREIAGLSWAEADVLRKGMSKFQAEAMEALKSTFVAGCMRPAPEGPAFAENQARTLWEQVVAFAGYGFNQGHATAYADVSYRSAYLKTHYPAQFLCARLRSQGGFHHPAIYIAEARRLGCVVRAPHVNFSESRFTLTHGRQGEPTLWMGLGQVRDLRRASVKAIISAREEGPFSDLRDLWQRVPLHPKEIQNLVRCGALDDLGRNRPSMLAEIETIDRAGSVQQMAFDFFTRTGAAAESLAQRLAWEQDLLGMAISVHPLQAVPLDETAVPLRQLSGSRSARVRIRGMRLPGWTGGKGFFLDDGDCYVIVITGERLPATAAWQALALEGRWRTDEWGGGWFQAESIEILS